MLRVNALLHNSAATDEELADGVGLWCLTQQPCQFGRAAAKQKRIHFSFLRDEDVSSWTDDEIGSKLREDIRLWKQRGAFDPNRSAHSLVIVVASPRVAFAAPDQHLRAFSDRILALTDWQPDRRGVRRQNTLSSDFLYLRNPVDRKLYGFRFNADYFACAADGRWWHDHRFPGGIAFTANSTGHMIRFREWYLEKPDSEAWGLKQAMLTIQNSAQTQKTESQDPIEQGRVTWLRDVDQSGQPLVSGVGCPLSEVPRSLSGKDWTRYEGLLHTDHAVRAEFFVDRELAATRDRPYLMDFTYLHDRSQSDYTDFTAGKPFTDEQVFAEIGRPETWTHRATPASRARSADQAIVVAEQMHACQSLTPSPWYDKPGEPGYHDA